MARINVETSLFTDARFYSLLFAFKDQDKALGTIVRLWIVGQKYFLTNNGIIPIKVWEQQGLAPELITCGFAREAEGGYYVCGANKHFAWLRQLSIAGRTSSDNRRGHRVKEVSQNSTKVERTLTEVNVTATSYSDSDSCSRSYSDSNPHKNEECTLTEGLNAKEQIQVAAQEWKATLTHFAIDRDAQRDESNLLRLIKAHGLDDTLLALRGMRLEQGSENFTPARHVALHRLSKPNIFEKFVNLGATTQKPTSLKLAPAEIDLDGHSIVGAAHD